MRNIEEEFALLDVAYRTKRGMVKMYQYHLPSPANLLAPRTHILTCLTRRVEGEREGGGRGMCSASAQPPHPVMLARNTQLVLMQRDQT